MGATGQDDTEEPGRQDEDMPSLPPSSSEDLVSSFSWEDKEEVGQDQQHHQGDEVLGLLDNLRTARYWSTGEGSRNRRPPIRLGEEQERGYWEEMLPR